VNDKDRWAGARLSVAIAVFLLMAMAPTITVDNELQNYKSYEGTRCCPLKWTFFGFLHVLNQGKELRPVGSNICVLRLTPFCALRPQASRGQGPRQNQKQNNDKREKG
jgi:MFS-type transporter involved in bile tolerance (Atg22 family)